MAMACTSNPICRNQQQKGRHRMTLRITRNRYASLLVALVAALAMAMAASSAYAGGYQVIKSIPAKSWSCGYCGVQEPVSDIVAAYGNNSTICDGPVTYSGGTYHTPYGWACQSHQIVWEFSPITAWAAVYNPNPGTMTNITEYWS